MKLKALSEIKKQKANFILAHFLPLPKNAVTLLSSSGGVGKTRLALICASKYVLSENRPCALWLTEDFPGQVRFIFEQLCEDGICDLNAMKKIHLILDEPPQLAKKEGGIFKANYGEISKIGENLIKLNVGFVVFDPLLAFYGGSENDNSEARVFIQTFAEWAKNAEITTLIIHHNNKNGTIRGASGFHDGVRARYALDFPRNDKGEIVKELLNKGLRVIRLEKDNWGAFEHFYKLTDGEDAYMLKVATDRDKVLLPSEPAKDFILEL